MINWRIYLLKNNKNNEFWIKLINCGIEIRNEKDLKLKLKAENKIIFEYSKKKVSNDN